MTLISTLGQLGKGHKDISTLITTPSYLPSIPAETGLTKQGIAKKYD